MKDAGRCPRSLWRQRRDDFMAVVTCGMKQLNQLWGLRFLLQIPWASTHTYDEHAFLTTHSRTEHWMNVLLYSTSEFCFRCTLRLYIWCLFYFIYRPFKITEIHAFSQRSLHLSPSSASVILNVDIINFLQIEYFQNIHSDNLKALLFCKCLLI